MSYKYEEIKPRIFEEDNQVLFLKIRDQVKAALAKTGAFRLGDTVLMHNCGDSWTMLACVDRLVELKEIREVTNGNCAAQERIFTTP